MMIQMQTHSPDTHVKGVTVSFRHNPYYIIIKRFGMALVNLLS